jgi:hypothetical protein
MTIIPATGEAKVERSWSKSTPDKNMRPRAKQITKPK